jgi:hypothetical protein
MSGGPRSPSLSSESSASRSRSRRTVTRDRRERLRLCENSAEFSHTADIRLFSRPEVDQKQKKSRKIFVRAIVRFFRRLFTQPGPFSAVRGRSRERPGSTASLRFKTWKLLIFGPTRDGICGNVPAGGAMRPSDQPVAQTVRLLEREPEDRANESKARPRQVQAAQATIGYRPPGHRRSSLAPFSPLRPSITTLAVRTGTVQRGLTSPSPKSTSTPRIRRRSKFRKTLRAVKPILRGPWNDGYGTDCGRSRGGRWTGASRPFASFLPGTKC